MKISISGTPGAGKSTVAKLLAKKLGMKYYSVGDLRGRMAMERGMTIEEFNKLGEKEFFTDKLADEYQKELGKNEDNFVIDGRLSFHFIPDSVKVYLTADMDVAAQRIFLNPRPDEREYRDIEEVRKSLLERMESDKKRYLKYYGIDPFRPKHYDIVIDTTSMSSEDVAEKIIEVINREFRDKKKGPKD